MKNIQELLNSRQPLDVYVESSIEDISSTMIDESLKDLFNIVKNKFKQAWQYLKGLVVKLGNYFVVPVNNEGNPEPVILPPTMGFAYKAGAIDPSTTFIHLNNDDAKICGLKNNVSGALKLAAYTRYKNKIDYLWDMCKNIKEASDEQIANLCEVKLEADDPNGLKVVDNKLLKMLIKQAWRTRGQAGRLCIWGAPGIGKTAIISAAIKEIDPNARLIVKTLANETGESFSLPDYVIDPETGEKTGAHDVLKTWLPMYKVSGNAEIDAERDRKLGTGLLFVDELSRANPQAKNVILPIINEGLFEGYKLGSGWAIIAASNRLEDDPNENFSNGMALMNRFKHVYYQPSVSTWKGWAEKQGFMSPLLLQWLSLPESENMSGGKYYYYDPNPDLESSDASSAVMCTPRSWTKAMMELADIAQNELDIDAPLSDFRTIMNIPPEMIRIAFQGNVTNDACESFLAFLNVISSVGDFDSVIEGVWKTGGAGLRVDSKIIRKVALPLSQLIITAHPELPTSEEMTNLAKFITTQGNDQMATYIMDIFKNTFLAEIAGTEAYVSMMLYSKSIDKLSPAGKNAFVSKVTPILQRYGIRDIKDWPDYSEFVKIISKKFGQIFSTIKLDGKDGLI